MPTFTQHCALVALTGIIPPRPVTVQPVRVSPSLLSRNREQIDAFADDMLKLEHQRKQAAEAEQLTEGRAWPTSANPHDD